MTRLCDKCEDYRTIIEQALQDKNMSLYQLCLNINYGNSHMRTLKRGGVPYPSTTGWICEELGLDKLRVAKAAVKSSKIIKNCSNSLGYIFRLTEYVVSISCVELASTLGVDDSTVIAWSAGRSRPTAHRRELLCNILQVTEDYLLLLYRRDDIDVTKYVRRLSDWICDKQGMERVVFNET